MKLQELLAKATGRPWEIGPCPCGASVCKSFVLTKPFNVDGRLTKSDALLQRHAVNQLEPLLVALRGIMIAMQAIVETMNPLNLELARSIIAKQVKVSEEAIREVEEVTP